jgi:hypothetical protein
MCKSETLPITNLLKLFFWQTSPNEYSATVLLGHQHFVSCVLAIPPSASLPTGAILSGGHDRTISGQVIVAPVVNVWVDGQLAGSLTVSAVKNQNKCAGKIY